MFERRCPLSAGLWLLHQTLHFGLVSVMLLPYYKTTSVVSAAESTSAADVQRLSLHRGDRIAIIGNTLADRMQHFGHVEAALHNAFPTHELVIRNLGFSGDTLTTRPRSDNFGTPDEWLNRVKADVILAFFGYNESFGDEAGLDQFRKELTDFIEHTVAQRYNGRSAPRLVLFSPTACEDLKWPHVPDGVENNKRLAMYTKAMQSVAESKGVAFVDLFAANRKIYGLANWDVSVLRNLDGVERDRFGKKLPPEGTSGTLAFPPATINGVHLDDFGYRGLAAIISGSLFPEQANSAAKARLEAIRTAVLDKNLHWHNIYRATDGYSVFGGRSTLKFVDGQTNFEVMQRELEILDAMVANRDRVIWKIAGGADPKTTTPDDSGVPQPLEVKTNKPGALDGGQHRFLTGEEAISEMTVHSGMSIGLFASEEQFPELVNPVQSAVDPDGRLWVAAWPTYPHWNPLGEMNDKLLILPDDDGDGKADRCITFADGLHNPTGFEFWNGGVLVAMAPDIFFLKDLDGDDICDVRERMFHGLDSADTHHTANSFVMGPSGRYYFSRGIFHYENFETPWGPTSRFGSSPCGVFEFDPLRFDIRFQFPIGPNPHGDCFDQWGNQFATDGTGGTGDYIGFPGHGSPRKLYRKRVRPVPATVILDSPHFPEANRGNLLIANVIGFQGVTQYEFGRDGASLQATEVEPIVYSTDPNFRPSDMEIAGDGSLLILDWHNPLIGHMQHNLRDPSRDHGHGRVYRVTANNRPVIPVARMRGKPVQEVVSHLSAPTLSERYRARLELTGRNPQSSTEAASEWAAQFDASKPENARHLTEALWVHQQHRVPDMDLLSRVLGSPEPNARAAEVKVLAEWSTPNPSPAVADGTPPLPVDETISMLVDLASDPSPIVRAQAVIAAANINAAGSAEVIFTVMQHPTDVQIDFNLKEAAQMMDLNGYIREQLAAGNPLSVAAEAFALSNASVEELLKMQKTEAVYRAILTRENVPAETLRASLSGLAELSGKTEIEELFSLIEGLNDEASVNILNSLSRLLANQPTQQLASVRDRIVRLAVTTPSAETRRVSLAAWMNVDGTSDGVFEAVAEKKVELEDVLRSTTLVSSTTAQSSMRKQLLDLIPEMPGHKGAVPLTRPGLKVDFFAPSTTNVALETLAAMTPKASGTADIVTMDLPILLTRDAFALRFTGHVKIETPGEYTFFIASDDGSRFYLNNQLLINNDGLHGMVERSGTVNLTAGLHAITATYFDNGGGDGLHMSWKGPGIGKEQIPANAFVTAADQTLQDLGIAALMQLPGDGAAKTGMLARLLKDRASVNSALQALNTIEADAWPREQYGPLAEAAVSYLASREPEERNSDQAQLALKIADALRTRLDEPGRSRFEKRLSEVVVPLIEIGTVRERMIYDKETIVVQSGKAVQFRLTNTDNMPHNFAVVLPGSLEEVGELAETTGRDADAAARHFVPVSDKILASSDLMQPEQTVSVFFEAPEEPGVYPYVCTYPGHWRRMYGALYVVQDLSSWDADPAAYMAAHPMPVKDTLLKYLGRNTDWQLSDLKGDAMHLSHRANNFAVGRQLFKVASCSGCHKMANEGTNVGPDLTKLPAEYSVVDVLDHILNPSKKIDTRYQSNTFVLTSGKVITGLVIEDTDKEVRVVDNPTTPDKPVVIRKSDIDERNVSDVSIMPRGVLNKLTREEILDLLAFVVAKGEAQHKLFQTHEHQH
ncbi:MAG: c-type cytochrome [Planctomycetaceae bacterium]|nr:c-type cytochrome [Planctomycetaceae bacterium]